MRTLARTTSGFAAAGLAFLLAACGGGEDQASPANSTGNAKQTAPATKTASLPDKSVCDVFSKDTVSRIIGKAISSADNVDLFAGAQPVLCYYYTDAKKVDSVKIQWATSADALWDEQVAAIGTSTGGDTVRIRVKGLGDDAIKENTEIDGVKAVTYDVLLKRRDIVLSVTDTSGLPDAILRNLTKEVVQTTDKL